MIGSDFVELHTKGSAASIFIRACEVEAFEQGVIRRESGGTITMKPSSHGCNVYFCGKSVEVEENCETVMQLLKEAEM